MTKAAQAPSADGAVPHTKERQLPASRGQLAGMVILAVLGAVLGVALVAAASLGGTPGTAVWVFFAICEALAALAGGAALIMQQRRHEFVTEALTLAWRLETSPPGQKLSPELDEMISRAQQWQSALTASGDLGIAGRLQNALRGREHGGVADEPAAGSPGVETHLEGLAKSVNSLEGTATKMATSLQQLSVDVSNAVSSGLPSGADAGLTAIANNVQSLKEAVDKMAEAVGKMDARNSGKQTGSDR